MLNVSNLCKNAYTCTVIQARNKTKTHWAKLKKKDSPKYKALNHFDDFYGSVFGDKWAPMREALLRRNKYVAVVNNYGDTEETIEFLEKKEFHNQYSPPPEPKSTETVPVNRLAEFAEKLHSDEIAQLYPQGDNVPEKMDFTGDEKNQQTTNETLDESLSQAVIDESRIIDPSLGITSEALYQFTPATKLKGMDEWETDFPLVIEAETELSYPEHLKVYTYEMDSELTSFPEPRRGATGVHNYYPMDGGSVLAVLALGLRPGDRVLDLCSAPGGKALVALQTLLPDCIVCNDVSPSRCNSPVHNDGVLHAALKHAFETHGVVAVVKCHTPWHVVYSTCSLSPVQNDGVLHAALKHAFETHGVLAAVNPVHNDGVLHAALKHAFETHGVVAAVKCHTPWHVVYSTCSLSPVHNDGVLHAALKHAFETHGVVAAVNSTLELGAGRAAPKYGQLVLPSVSANFGPSYVAKL
ncbi:putative methyltransferase NSUN4, partial [Operophtera brumata]